VEDAVIGAVCRQCVFALVSKRPRRQTESVKFLAYSLLLLGFATLSAHARLGETEEQIISRFGTPADAPKFEDDLPGVTYKLFSKQNFNIYVGLIDGKSAYECYQADSGVDDSLIKQLLAIESEGHRWGRPQKWSDWNSGRIRDDGAVAYVWKSAFIAESKEFADMESARRKKMADNRKPRVDGF
jgi:hypothetical protein